MTRISVDDGLDAEPVWSADGKRIAYLNTRNLSSGPLRIVHADTGEPISIPVSVQGQGKLAFHPDGRRLLGTFRSAEWQGGVALAWLDLQTGKLTAATDPPRPTERAALSVDGRWIAYATHRDVFGQQSGNDGPQADVWKVPSTGGKPVKIGRFPARVYDLCWSADAHALVIATDLGGAHNDLWQVPLADPLHGSRKLTFGQADEDRPSVSADGRWLLYTDNHEGCAALVLRDLHTGVEQTLSVNGMDYHIPAGSLRLTTVDKGTGTPVVARISLTDRAGKFYAPPGALYRLERGKGHFYCRDNAELKLPAGEYQLRVYRGPEYRPVRRAVQVEAGKSAEVTVELERWVDATALGLYSGENHIHANYGYGEWYNTPASMLDQCEGEDLNVCNFMVANSDGLRPNLLPGPAGSYVEATHDSLLERGVSQHDLGSHDASKPAPPHGTDLHRLPGHDEPL
jgi:hypothetical protein